MDGGVLFELCTVESERRSSDEKPHTENTHTHMCTPTHTFAALSLRQVTRASPRATSVFPRRTSCEAGLRRRSGGAQAELSSEREEETDESDSSSLSDELAWLGLG